MTLYHYKAVTPSGETLEGRMDVASPDEVVSKLQDAGNIPLEVRDADTAGGGGLFSALTRKATLSEAQIVQLTTQLATLLGAGQPLDRALQILLDLPDSERAKKLLERVRESVRGGTPLSSALEQQHGVFSRLYVNMVRAGEASGSLQETLRRLAEYLERSQAMRDWLVSESRRRGEDAAGQILALFDALAEWFEKSEFRACLALNTTLEIADPEHPARVEAMNHKVAMRAILEDLAIRAGAERPKELGDQLLILIHGSIALAAAWKSPAPALRAKQVARVLLDA